MTETLGNNAEGQLKGFAERVIKLDEEIAERSEDRKQVFLEAKATGFDDKVLRKVVRELQMDEDKRKTQLEFELVVDVYRKAVGLKTNEDVMAEEARRRIAENQNGKSVVEQMVEEGVRRGGFVETGEPGVYEMAESRRDKKSGARSTIQLVKD